MPKNNQQKDKKSNLTPTEQAVYFELVRRRVARTSDLKEVISDRSKLNTVLSSICSKGYALRVFRGLYAAVPPEFLDMDLEVDRYLVAQSLHTGVHAISHHTALELHGVAQSTFNEVFVSIDRSRHDLHYQDVRYRFVYDDKGFGARDIMHDGIKVRVTDRERTILDCIRRPKYCGGLEEMLKSVAGFVKIDTNKTLEYLGQFDETSLYHRAGYILDKLRDELEVDTDLLLEIKGHVGDRCYYLDGVVKKGRGRLDKRWNVIVDGNIEERMRVV